MKTEIQEKEVTLIHHKSNEQKTFVMRQFAPGEEDAVLECITEEYGDTYYRREFYDKYKLRQMTESGSLLLFLAWCGDDVCGMQTIISYEPEETRLEAASQIFRKIYRGYGLPFELVKYTYEVAGSLKPSCIYASTVLFHKITQTMCEEVGMIPVAFNFGSHLTSKMHNSFALGASEKYGQAILILPVDKTDAGDVYIHNEIAESVERLYRNLGVAYNIISSKTQNDCSEIPLESELKISVNEREQSISIKVYAIGQDLMDRVREVKKEYSGEYWTIQLILPVDNASALTAYEGLREEKFFYAGIRPLCSEKEQIFMQYTGNVYFNFDDFKLTEGFRLLLKDILKQYGG